MTANALNHSAAIEEDRRQAMDHNVGPAVFVRLRSRLLPFSSLNRAAQEKAIGQTQIVHAQAIARGLSENRAKIKLSRAKPPHQDPYSASASSVDLEAENRPRRIRSRVIPSPASPPSIQSRWERRTTRPVRAAVRWATPSVDPISNERPGLPFKAVCRAREKRKAPGQGTERAQPS